MADWEESKLLSSPVGNMVADGPSSSVVVFVDTVRRYVGFTEGLSDFSDTLMVQFSVGVNGGTCVAFNSSGISVERCKFSVSFWGFESVRSELIFCALCRFGWDSPPGYKNESYVNWCSKFRI